jgi:hypothetical protein
MVSKKAVEVEVDRGEMGLTRRVALFVALMTVEMPVRELLRSIRRFASGGGPSGPGLSSSRDSWFDLFSRTLLRWLEIVSGNLPVLYGVFTFGGNFQRVEGISIALNKLLLLDFDGGIHVGLGEFPFVWRWIRGRHVDVTTGIGAGFAFSHRFPSDYRKKVRYTEKTTENSARAHLKGT